MEEDRQEACPPFYSREYFLSASAGAGEYRETQGTYLDAYKERVLRLAALEPGETVLGLGCGRGEVVLACLQAGCNVWGLDFSPDAIELTQNTVRTHYRTAQPRLRLVVADAALAAMPLAAFDCIITSDFVEHLLSEHLERVIGNVRLWLRPKERFVLHTSPSLGYMYFGQYVARLLELLQGKPVQPLESFEKQLSQGGHCNIQSVRSLRALLAGFPSARVWAEFSADEGALKAALNRLRLTPWLAYHLYAVATT